MARSLPPLTEAPAEATVQVDLRDRLQRVVGAPTLRAIARMPDRVKKLLLGGRSITIDGKTLDTTLQLALASSRLSGREGLILSEHPPTARARLNALGERFPRVPADVTTSEIFIPGPVGDIPAVHIRPNRGADRAPLLVFFHGGGFVVGGYATHGNMCEVVADRAGVHVLFVDYRLAPEHKAPAAAEDAYAAYRWACDHADDLGADEARVVVGGDSAGGNLAAVTALMTRDRSGPVLAGQFLLYPVIGATFDTKSYHQFGRGFYNPREALRWYWDQYVPNPSDRLHPYASPLSADLSGAAPAVIVLNGHDPLRDEGVAYADALAAAGVPTVRCDYTGAVHGFMTMPMLNIAHDARRRVCAELAALLDPDRRVAQ